MNEKQRHLVDWSGKWIWSAGSTKRPFHISCFRKEFNLKKAARAVRIHCAADSKYRLWVNGRYLGFGPARGHSQHPYYDTHVVSLKAGQNTIAFLVQHYTDRSSIFASVQGGLICQVEAGPEIVAATDASWRALSSKAYHGLPGVIFPESFDARAQPEGWQEQGFDASHWPYAKVRSSSKLAPPDALWPRPIPLIPEKRLAVRRLLGLWRSKGIDPQKLWKEKDIANSLWKGQHEQRQNDIANYEGPKPPIAWKAKPLALELCACEAVYLTLDFGKETLACPEIVAHGPAGVIVDIGYSECLDDDRVATLWQGIRQSERIVLRNGTTRHRITQPRGFRFMVLRIANTGDRAQEVTLEDIAAYEAIYPAKLKGGFECSDPLLDRIYGLSARTVNLCMEDAYTDCPWRERSQWVGDAQPETLFSYFCFGAYDLARKAVVEFTSGNTEEGWIPGVFPTGQPSNLPTWGMRVPVIAWEYYIYTGDRSVLPDSYEGVQKQMAWLARYEDKHGRLRDMPGWCFVDWTKLDEARNDGAVQGWYVEALDCSAKLAAEVGDTKGASVFRRKGALLRKSLARSHWSPKRRAFLKYGRGSGLLPVGVSADLIGQHENFLFTLLKVGTAAQRRQALDAVAGVTGRYLPNLGDYQSVFRPDGQRGNTTGSEDIIKLGSPFWSYYALLALMESRRVAEAIEYIRLCWGMMLEHGATSCWEMWDRHTSLCHGWSAAPAMVLPAYVLGVQPVRPGFELFSVRPHPGDLAWASGRVPTPKGTIDVKWTAEEHRFTAALSVPPGTFAEVYAPVDSTTKWRLTHVDGRRVSSRKKVVLGKGGHKVVFASTR